MSTKSVTAVTAEQVGQFREQGFLAIPRLVDDAVVARLREGYDQFLSGEIGGEDNRLIGGVARQVMYPHRHHPYFANNPARDAARQLAETVSGCEVEFFYDMLISKEPGNTNPTVWHQDFAYFEVPFTPAGRRSPNEMMQFWLALDDVDETTGCMHFVPRSHEQPLREHYVFAGDPEGENRMLGTDDYDEAAAVPCPLSAGGCTIHFDGTLHYTGGNHSIDRMRRAYIFSFRPVGTSR